MPLPPRRPGKEIRQQAKESEGEDRLCASMSLQHGRMISAPRAFISLAPPRGNYRAAEERGAGADEGGQQQRRQTAFSGRAKAKPIGMAA